MGKNQSLITSKGTFKSDMDYAHWCIIHGEYDKARRTLYKVISDRESNSYRIFYMLGVSCFMESDITSARKFFEAVLERNANHSVSLLYLAVIGVLADNKQEAISNFLHAQSNIKRKTQGGSSKYIKRGLDYIKHYSQHEDKLRDIFSEPYKNKIIPEYGLRERKRKIMRNFVFLSAMLGLIAFLGYNIYDNLFRQYFSPENDRSIELKEIEKKIQQQDYVARGLDEVHITLNNRAYNRLISGIKDDFVDYKDNTLWVKANTILYSDRDLNDKARIRLITDSLLGVDFSSDVRWYTYDEVSVSPWMYDNVTITWKGTIAKITALENEIAEDYTTASEFLVDYYGDNKEIKEIVRVFLPSYIQLENGNEVELLATIKYRRGKEELEDPLALGSDAFYMLVKAYRQLGAKKESE